MKTLENFLSFFEGKLFLYFGKRNAGKLFNISENRTFSARKMKETILKMFFIL